MIGQCLLGDRRFYVSRSSTRTVLKFALWSSSITWNWLEGIEIPAPLDRKNRTRSVVHLVWAFRCVLRVRFHLSLSTDVTLSFQHRRNIPGVAQGLGSAACQSYTLFQKAKYGWYL